MNHLTLTVEKIIQETEDTKSFVLTSEIPLSYQAGQFLTIIRPTLTGEVRRQYSFSSHPAFDSKPTITVKRIHNGIISRWLFDEVKPGDIIHSYGVSGFFTLPENAGDFTTLLLLAAGSGITPVISILQEALHAYPGMKVVMVYSNHTKDTSIFFDKLQALEKQFKNRLIIEFLFSDAKNLMRARLGKTVLEDLFQQHIKEPLYTLAYVCGPLDYRQMAMVTLLAQGIPATQLFKEVFHTPPARQTIEPDDQRAHRVHIDFQQKQYELLVQYPISILQAAKKAGLDLPYSCEAGRCGACTATCSEGKIWMSRNEVLTDADLAKGRILTCTSFPVDGDASIKL